MDFNEYQEKAWKTAIYPNKGNNLIYPVLGLGGETGEVLEKIKKIMRDEKNQISEKKKEKLKKELGDVLWYLSSICKELNITLNDVVNKNISKLNSRKKRNQLHGSGDNR